MNTWKRMSTGDPIAAHVNNSLSTNGFDHARDQFIQVSVILTSRCTLNIRMTI
jgi:hypothetical protein